MPVRGSTSTPYRVLRFIAFVSALTQILFLVDANFSRSKQFQESDYIMTFYVAGQLAAAGRVYELYPAENALSFIGAPFDRAAHQLLDSLPAETTAIYMYSPLIAGLFAPLSHVSPNVSLLIWQALSIVALAVSCKLLSQAASISFSEDLFLISLFGPIFITLWSGQLGLVFGLLPLSAGFVFLLQDRPLGCGFTWSLLLLKPQYFPAAAFVVLVTTIKGNVRPLCGLLVGTLLIVGANFLFFPPALIEQWISSHRLSDSLFTQAQYGIPSHLVTSLPADILLLLPKNLRATAKWPAYAAALLVWVVGLYSCWRIHHGPWSERTKLSLTLILGCCLSSIALPHLLYYDLCVLIPVGFLLMAGNSLLPKDIQVRIPSGLVWLCVSAYLPIFLFFKPRVEMALTLEIVLLFFLLYLMVAIDRAIKRPNAL